MVLAASLVRRGAAAFPDRTAVLAGDESLTYAEVDARADLIAHHLRGHGVGKGTHVALLVGNGLHSVPMEFASIKAGLVRVPLNARLSVEEHADMLAGSHATVVVADAALLKAKGLGRNTVCDPSPRRDAEAPDTDAQGAQA